MLKALLFQKTLSYGFLGIALGAFLHSICSLFPIGFLIIPGIALLSFALAAYLDPQSGSVLQIISLLTIVGVVIGSPVIEWLEAAQTIKLPWSQVEKINPNNAAPKSSFK